MTDSPSSSGQDSTPADLIEALSEKVHEAWAAEKQRQGFADHALARYDSPRWKAEMLAKPCARCDASRERHHPDMLPYGELAENVKEYDRATVRGVMAALDDCGYAIVPKGAQP